MPTQLIQQLGKFSILIVLAFTLSCNSKKAKEDKDKAANTGSETAAISQESMNFNPAGSDSGTIDGLRTVNFAYDSSSLDPKARGLLKEDASWIKGHSGLMVQIEGHCDTHGSVEYNLALGERRAKTVKDYLVGLGVESKRLSIVSYGKEKLLEIGDTEAIHAKNRRANFVPLSN